MEQGARLWMDPSDVTIHVPCYGFRSKLSFDTLLIAWFRDLRTFRVGRLGTCIPNFRFPKSQMGGSVPKLLLVIFASCIWSILPSAGVIVIVRCRESRHLCAFAIPASCIKLSIRIDSRSVLNVEDFRCVSEAS